MKKGQTLKRQTISVFLATGVAIFLVAVAAVVAVDRVETRLHAAIGHNPATELEAKKMHQTPDEVGRLMYYGAGLSVFLLVLTSAIYFFNRKKIADGEQRLRSILESVLDGLITINGKGIIESVNPATASIFGYDQDEMIGRNVKMLMPEPYHSAHDGYLENYMQTGNAKIIGIGREVRGLRRDGSVFPLDLGVSEFSIGGERMFLGIVRDVTERHQASEELNKFKSTLDNTGDCVFMFSPEPFRYFYANRGGMDQVGYSFSELLHMSPVDLMPSYSLHQFQDVVAPLMKGEKESATFETIHEHKDGSLIPVEIFLQYISPEGEDPRFVAVVRDISERLRAQEQLKRSEANLTKAQAIAHIGSWSWNIVSGDLYWSDEIYRIFGLEPQQFGATYEAFMAAVHPDDREAVQNAINESLEGTEPYFVTHRIVLPNGVVRVVEEQGEAEYNDEGAPVYMNGIVQDVTERQAADQMKREFISTVSHELRTPLTAIHGSHGLLLGGAAGELGDQARSLLSIAHDNSDRLIRLINDILDVEKLEAGKMRFEMVEEDLLELVRKSITSNEAYAQKHDIEFTLDKGAVTGKVYVDCDRVAQVMTNYLSNAAKFSPSGSGVVVSISDTGEGFRVSVTDQGPGIPEEFQDRIFQRFAQADSSDTRKKGGTGLGLSITKAIVEHMGGEVGFDTKAGEGSTFWFTLPKAEQAGLQISSADDRGAGNARILICEDDKDIAHILREQMGALGFDADIAFNGASAKTMLEANVYHAMTLDLILPDMDGMMLLKWVREQDRTCNLPVIVVSAIADETRTTLNGGALHVIDWIKKPIDSTHLARALGSAVLSQQGATPQVLHVEDDADIAELVRVSLKGVAEVSTAPSIAVARNLMASRAFDLVLLDVALPDGSGLSLLPDLQGGSDPSVPVIVFSATDFNADVAKDVTAILTKSKNGIEDIVSMIKGLIGS